MSEVILSFEADGFVFHHGTAAGGSLTRYELPLLVYPPPPLNAGEAWQSSTRAEDLEVVLATEVVGFRGVATDTGRCNALHLHKTTLTSSGGLGLLDLFLVPTVGSVRFVTPDGTTLDLIERTP